MGVRRRFSNGTSVLTGAKGVASCFSAANIKTERTSAAVVNISIKTPCAALVPCCRKLLEVMTSLEQTDGQETSDVLDREGRRRQTANDGSSRDCTSQLSNAE